ncbi:MAG TPA: DUF4139 domain-containing protein [Gallionellaceae bacterium]
MKRSIRRGWLGLAVCTLLSGAACAAEPDEVRSTLHDQHGVAVTIYNNDLALVKDQRKIKLRSGLNRLALRDVSAQMRPETALLRSLSDPGSISVLEQNFDFDLLTPQKLLEKYVGRNVSVIRTNPANGKETTEQATVLSASGGVVMRIGNRIETGLPGRIVYDDVPANLRDRPTLVTRLSSSEAAEQAVELSYLTGGLAWKADYVAELSPDERSIDLSGWVTLTNTSGASYNNARLQLVAGDVNRVQEYFRANKAKVLGVVAAPAMAEERAMAEESLMEYHLYTLERPTTIAENQTKQVALLSASNVPARKELLLSGADYYYMSSYGDLGQKMKVGVFLEFDNKEAAHLGMPLPKGIIRVYKKDKAGNAQFVGEDNVDHTPRNEKVRLKLGESFDVTADKKQTDFKSHPAPFRGGHQVEAAFEIVLKNARKEAAVVTVQEPIPGDWKIVSESHRSSKPTAHTASWSIEVPPEGKTTLSYRVQVKY